MASATRGLRILALTSTISLLALIGGMVLRQCGLRGEGVSALVVGAAMVWLLSTGVRAVAVDIVEARAGTTFAARTDRLLATAGAAVLIGVAAAIRWNEYRETAIGLWGLAILIGGRLILRQWLRRCHRHS